MIFHITTSEAWEEAMQTGAYRGDTLETEGFIHCSERYQVAGVANALFAGRTDLILLMIEPDKVRAEIRYERAPDASGPFPHIYGPLDIESVVDVVEYRARGGWFIDP